MIVILSIILMVLRVNPVRNSVQHVLHSLKTVIHVKVRIEDQLRYVNVWELIIMKIRIMIVNVI